MAPLLEEIAAAYGTADFERVFGELYPQMREHQRRLRHPRAAFGEGRGAGRICIACRRSLAGMIWDRGRRCTSIIANRNRAPMLRTMSARAQEASPSRRSGNYVYSPKKFVALVGVQDLVVVETDDAILITTRQHSQDVGKVVKELVRGVRLI